jgi:hypothetical protein
MLIWVQRIPKGLALLCAIALVLSRSARARPGRSPVRAQGSNGSSRVRSTIEALFRRDDGRKLRGHEGTAGDADAPVSDAAATIWLWTDVEGEVGPFLISTGRAHQGFVHGNFTRVTQNAKTECQMRIRAKSRLVMALIVLAASSAVAWRMWAASSRGRPERGAAALAAAMTHRSSAQMGEYAREAAMDSVRGTSGVRHG